jgi:hypothetical protein
LCTPAKPVLLHCFLFFQLFFCACCSSCTHRHICTP